MSERMVKVLTGDCREVLKTLPDCSVHCCVTSPPYWGLRDYGHDSQIGLEQTPEDYVAEMVAVFREVRRVLREDGVLFLNLGDSYWGGKGQNGTSKALGNAKERGYQQPRGTIVSEMRPQDGKHDTLKPKDLVGIPWRVAFALQADGWYLRQDIIWAKPNPMPESVTDRCTKAHEYIFLLAKSERYYYDNEAVKEAATTPVDDPRNVRTKNNGEDAVATKIRGEDTQCGTPSPGTRNRRSVWTVATQPYSGAHFATFPPALITPCIMAGTSERGCCPKCGKPWERVVEKPEMPKVETSTLDRYGTGDAGVHRKVGQAYQDWRAANPDRTTGWCPGCSCGGEPVPCTVLDPFGGSGTTGSVASGLGRAAVLVELNPEYAKLAQDRCGLFCSVTSEAYAKTASEAGKGEG